MSAGEYLRNDTIVALATHEGASGICVIRLSGSESIRIAATFLPAPAKLFAALPYQSFHTTILAGGEAIDDGVVTVFRAPHSFTGEDVVEIAAHGSQAIASAIVRISVEQGARNAEPGEFSYRAFYNGKLSLAEVERIKARTSAIDGSLLASAERAIAEKFDILHAVYDDIIALLALVNAEIDFGESDHLAIPNFDERLSQARTRLEQLLARSTSREANAAPFTVAFVGPPNAGKSSIFNALISLRRSIVSPVAGTTRDYVESFIELSGMRIKLIDTAGEREAQDDIESEGITLGSAAALAADLVFRVTAPEYRDAAGQHLLHNKSDLDGYAEGLAVSAKTGHGMDALRDAIVDAARQHLAELSRPRISTAERLAIERTLRDLASAELTSNAEPAIVANILHDAAFELAPLLGVNISEDSLRLIFGTMCIGK